MQDSSLEELEALPEEAAGGDEDREKEILMERIQSIKEEKQVSRTRSRSHSPSHSPTLGRRPKAKLVVALVPVPRAPLTAVFGVREGPGGARLLLWG